MNVLGSAGRWIASLLAIALVVGGGLLVGPAVSANALSGSEFDPGTIISDQYFFDSNAMSEAQIQSFLDSKVGRCSDSNCLNVLRIATSDRPEKKSDAGKTVCKAYAGAGDEPASRIIFKVQQACGVSAKVILVTLQKEQGLVTKNSVSAAVLERAMGYGCPDSTGGTCFSQYYGFFNQVYWAAWQFKRYGTPAVFGNYQPGWNTIKWNPNGACGSASVFITNRATAALYNYTPYQPNAAALANLSGTGDGCSSYGNRNFWVYYNNWFGSPTLPPGTPEGSLDATTTSPGAITLSGWAVDPDAVSATVAVSIQLDSSWLALYANKAGSDLSASYPGAGASHAFSGTLRASPGTHVMCIYLVNAGGVGGTSSLGCQTVIVPSGPAPLGAITDATASGGMVSFAGWAVQPDALTDPVPVAINYGSNWIPFLADKANSVAPVQVAGAGVNQGFGGAFAANSGLQTFCVWASPSIGPATQLGCRTLVVPEAKPSVSAIDSVTASATEIKVEGWSVWPDSPASSVPVAVEVDGNWYALSADRANPGAAATVPGVGVSHGFVGSIQASPGVHNVCVWAAQPLGGAAMVGCRSVTVASVILTRAAISSIAAIPLGVTVSGWAVWPGSVASSVPIAVNVGSNWYGFTADQPNPDAENATPGAGPNHGFVGTIPSAPGTYPVCIWAAQNGEAAIQIGCQSVTVSAGYPTVGELVSADGGVGGVHYSGWAVDPGTPSSSVPIAANIGSSWLALSTGEPSVIAPVRFSGAGLTQGYSGLFPVAPGVHTLCIWAASSSGAVNLGCKTVTVSPAPAVAGGIVTATAVSNGIDLSGWAVWPSALSSAVPVAANVGTGWTALPSNLPSSVTAKWVVGAGPNQGFAGTVAAPSGSQSVCIWASPPSGMAVMLGCKTVTVP